MATTPLQQPVDTAFSLEPFIGRIKTFGPWGPPYEILGSGRPGRKGETVHIRVFFTDEEVDYAVSEMLEDPYKP